MLLANSPRVLLPGAFNPVHYGHRRMLQQAQQTLKACRAWGGPAADFELSLLNVDKPMLGRGELQRRLRAFHPLDRIWLTLAPRFHQKAGLFPGVCFVIGADTLQRLANPRYYQGAWDQLRAYRRLEFRGARFIAFGRLLRRDRTLRFTSPDELPLPDALARLCRFVPGDAFRVDMSSSEIRAARDGFGFGRATDRG